MGRRHIQEARLGQHSHSKGAGVGGEDEAIGEVKIYPNGSCLDTSLGHSPSQHYTDMFFKHTAALEIVHVFHWYF